jgi:hypothetical protein
LSNHFVLHRESLLFFLPVFVRENTKFRRIECWRVENAEPAWRECGDFSCVIVRRGHVGAVGRFVELLAVQLGLQLASPSLLLFGRVFQEPSYAEGTKQLPFSEFNFKSKNFSIFLRVFLQRSFFSFARMSCSEQSLLHGQASGRV